MAAGSLEPFIVSAKNAWAGTENNWKGVFAFLASIIISIMSAALLRVSKLQGEWHTKLTKALEAKNEPKPQHGKNKVRLWCEKYAMFVLLFIKVLRQGLEAVVFAGGVTLGYLSLAFPIPVIRGVLAGFKVGLIVYK